MNSGVVCFEILGFAISTLTASFDFPSWASAPSVVEKKTSQHRMTYEAKREAHSKMHWREIRAEKVTARFLKEKESIPSGDPELNLVIKGILSIIFHCYFH